MELKTELIKLNTMDVQISEQEVLKFQEHWGEGIVEIGKLFSSGGDYIARAKQFIEKFYNYKDSLVLFKPTLASEKQFRTDFRGALSYFVSGDEMYPEDKGFALKPWVRVRFENAGIIFVGPVAIAMGNYYFTPKNSTEEVKVEFSFVLLKNTSGELKIILHDSHLPYTP